MDYLIESSCNPMAKILSIVPISEVKLESDRPTHKYTWQASSAMK